VAKKELDAILQRLDEAQLEKGGRVSPPVAPDPGGPAEAMIVRDAFLAEGLGPELIARKLRYLLSEKAKSPKWNVATREWEYFIDGKLWKDICELLIKVFGGFAPEAQINLHIDASLKDILENTSLSPEAANRKFKEYIDIVAEEIDDPMLVKELDEPASSSTTESQKTQ